jgi:hypothetical protein
MATGWRDGVRFPKGEFFFFLFYSVQTGSEAYPASYSIATGVL